MRLLCQLFSMSGDLRGNKKVFPPVFEVNKLIYSDNKSSCIQDVSISSLCACVFLVQLYRRGHFLGVKF